jgi:hypothetical protein
VTPVLGCLDIEVPQEAGIETACSQSGLAARPARESERSDGLQLGDRWNWATAPGSTPSLSPSRARWIRAGLWGAGPESVPRIQVEFWKGTPRCKKRERAVSPLARALDPGVWHPLLPPGVRASVRAGRGVTGADLPDLSISRFVVAEVVGN